MSTLTERVVHEALYEVHQCHEFCFGVQPEQATAVVQYLNENGFDLVPKTIIGSAGWTPKELSAWQAGVMWARHEKQSIAGIANFDVES